MKTNQQSDIALPLSPQVSQAGGEDHAVMPGEFAGMYQAGLSRVTNVEESRIPAGF